MRARSLVIRRRGAALHSLPLGRFPTNTIGLRYPSTSKRRCVPLESDNVADPPQQTPPRTTSSTIKRSTERFLATTQQNIITPRPVPSSRKRSYAQEE
jgi:hypothetical protein